MAQLTVTQKTAYASGFLSMNLANLVISQWLLKLYVPDKVNALVPLGLFSAIFLFGRIIDGVLDPLVGFYSDNARFKSGRRLPFIRAMIIPVALVSFLLWIPPHQEGYHWINAVYAFVVVQLFFVFWTILANPYLSLLPEITSDLKERVNVSTLQAVFLMLGTLLFAFIGPIKESLGWSGMGAIVGGLIIISFLPTAILIKEKHHSGSATTETQKPNLIRWARTSFRNRPFVILLTTTSLYWFALNCITIIVPFWIANVLLRSDADVALVMAPFLAANILFFFVFNWISKKSGKYVAFLVTLLGTAATMPLLYFVDGNALMLKTQVVMGFIGVFVAGFMMLPYAILSDVVDYDETFTGLRREGIYFGIQSIFQKISIGLSITLASWLMYWGGDIKPTVIGLKLIAVAGGAISLAAFLVFLRYPLREKQGKIFNLKA